MRKGLTEAQRRALGAIKWGRPVAGNDEGWVEPDCTRPTLNALERLRMVERSGYDVSGVMCGVGLCRLTPSGRQALADANADEGRNG